MLIPKRTKYRKQFRGRMKGKANRGNTIAHGQYGLVALEPAWITNRQIEQATWKSAEDALFNLAKYLKAQGDDYVSSIILNIRNEVITQHYSRKNRITN